VIPTRAGTDRSDLARIDGAADRTVRANTCVAPELACGENPVLPDGLAPCAYGDGGRPSPVALPAGWLFVDPARCGRRDGIYLALYRRTDEVSWGFVTVGSARGQSFATFVRRMLAANGARRYGPHDADVIVTDAGRRIECTPVPAPGVFPVASVDGRPLGDPATWPLVAGDLLRSDGHTGLVRLSVPCQQVVLDLRDALRPRVDRSPSTCG
jgi:hypothetical protein